MGALTSRACALVAERHPRADLGCSSMCSIENCSTDGGAGNNPFSPPQYLSPEGDPRVSFAMGGERGERTALSRGRLRTEADAVSVPTSIGHGTIGSEARGNFLSHMGTTDTAKNESVEDGES